MAWQGFINHANFDSFAPLWVPGIDPVKLMPPASRPERKLWNLSSYMKRGLLEYQLPVVARRHKKNYPVHGRKRQRIRGNKTSENARRLARAECAYIVGQKGIVLAVTINLY